jgi:multidrug efflux pump subunit AcrA (membrane-fusion protein)
MVLLYQLSRLRQIQCLGVVIGCVFFVSCTLTSSAGGNRTTNSNTSETQPAISITVGKSESRNVPSVIQATGSLVGDEISNVAPKVAGKVANIYVNAGQFVSNGAMLAKLDDISARQEVAAANAAVKQSVANVRQAEAKLGLGPNGKFDSSTIPEVRAANANYEQAVAEQRQAEANEKRYRELVESGDTPMITYETYRTARDTARAKTNNAKQTLEATVNAAKQSNQAIAVANAQVEATQAQVVIAQQNLDDTVIRSPFSGYISVRPIAVGEYVTSASTIVTIIRANPIKVQAQIPESEVPNVVPGHGVSVQVDAYKDRSFAGTVNAVNPAVDPTSRSAVVEAQIENGDNALRAGMFATVQITKEGGTKGIFVPKAAVFNDQTTQSFRVFVIQDGIAKLRVVQLGTEEGDSQQILSGVNPDETVAISNLDKLFEGAKVSF